MAFEGRVGLAGGGNMGAALLKGMLAAGVVRPDQVVVAEKYEAKGRALQNELGVQWVEDTAALPELEPLDMLILAVKPINLYAATQAANRALKPEALVISVAAGVTLAENADNLPRNQPLIRSMPNTPALVRRGVTALCAGPDLEEKYRRMAEEVFHAVGEVVWVAEHLMDAVTGLSGSGPAYVSVIVEALTDAGVMQGLDRPTAQTLAAYAVAGGADLIIRSGKHPAELKDMVTSPGGTAITGLQVIERSGLRGILSQVVEAATRRSKKLGERAGFKPLGE